ncbi:hypothetical protein [Halobaculum sp. MBLA0143]
MIDATDERGANGLGGLDCTPAGSTLGWVVVTESVNSVAAVVCTLG